MKYRDKPIEERVDEWTRALMNENRHLREKAAAFAKKFDGRLPSVDEIEYAYGLDAPPERKIFVTQDIVDALMGRIEELEEAFETATNRCPDIHVHTENPTECRGWDLFEYDELVRLESRAGCKTHKTTEAMLRHIKVCHDCASSFGSELAVRMLEEGKLALRFEKDEPKLSAVK